MKSKTVADVRGFPKTSPGALYLLATPIGNLEDITLRALRILREVDLVACEDTRQTQKLLNHFEVVKPTTSYEEHNEMVKAPELVMRMEEGAQIALVSDAGTPGISDPGYRLVQQCIRHNIPVVPVPGPSAAVASLVASGLPTHSFQFLGFLPPKPGPRRKVLQRLSDSPSTMIFFEAPHRITEALADILEIFGDRPVVLAREITKVHEEFLRGACSEVLEGLRQRPKIRGEMTVLVGGAGESTLPAACAEPLKERVRKLMQEQEMGRMEALKVVARERNISKSQAYREYQS
jgi:16S rRNA (cytidine1402-2'-O)-methyltransferase